MKRKTSVALVGFGIAALGVFFPITTDVAGHTKIVLLRENDAPIAGIKVRQSWGVYGYREKGGVDSGTTNSAGEIMFPPRKAIGFLGLRFVRRARAFLLTGQFASTFTERWGPIVGFDIDLPPGRWLPQASHKELDLLLPIFGDGPHRYVYLRNLDDLHPNAHISGDAQGFLSDIAVTLRIRPADAMESMQIREDPRREDLFRMSRM